ncbi:MAG: 50S ribosomal protein L21 [Patescibacteria group bacterium]
MKSYAIVAFQGHQYQAKEGEELLVDKIELAEGKKIVIDKVLLIRDQNQILVGQPTIEGASVEAELIQQLKGDKVRVATYKAKSRYRKVKGFRASLTRLKVTKIVKPKK